jgi:nucleoporin POM152
MIGSRSTPETKRTFTVLGKSAISFRDCGTAPDQVVSVLQGKGGKMLVSLNDIDPADGPWTFTMKYEPAAGLHTPKWTKDYVIPIDKKTIAVDVDKAGDYRIIKVKGRACPGEILSPETCRVIEQPVPSAEIEFKSIHEW